MTVLVDTNVIVRLIVNDQPDQVKRALAVLKSEGMEVSHTVLLECAWVLQSWYRFTRDQVLNALQSLERTQGISFSNAEAANTAIKYLAGGMDIADAIHLSQASEAKPFATFDEALVAKASRMSALPRIKHL